jgi:ADP-heptose:LPS heptosyltransferase
MIVSASSERELVTAIQSAARYPHPHIVTDAGLGFLAAVLEQADVVLGSDSGPLHIATAVGTPTVRLYGPTAPSLFGPWPPSDSDIVLRSLVPCSPCGHFDHPPCGAARNPVCLLEQTPEAVAQAACWLLNRPLGGVRPEACTSA